MAGDTNGENHSFITERLKFWKARRDTLKPTFQSTLDNIEKHGWEVMHMKADAAAPSFSYTIGVYETTGGPEIVQVGLRHETAHFALNEAANRLRATKLHVDQREADIIDKVDCLFRPVEDRWIQRIMYRAQWFYSDLSFPAVQCIYSDLANRFPWEEGFDASWRQRQALLFDRSEWTSIEEDLWAANDPNSSLTKWKWPDLPHTGAYVRESVANQKEPVLTVYHDHDGDWQFHGEKDGRGVLRCLRHLVDQDKALDELADLPRGWCAWRDSVGAPWQRETFAPTKDDEAPEEP